MIDQRSANRRREHAEHGWEVDARATATAPQLGRMGQCFMVCPCGWFGWVDAAVAPACEPMSDPAGTKGAS